MTYYILVIYIYYIKYNVKLDLDHYSVLGVLICEQNQLSEDKCNLVSVLM